MARIETFGSVCSGIEAASYILNPLGLRALWLSEIDDFPSRFLADRYKESPNIGDMNDIPERIRKGEIDIPDLLCGGTPCQAFSLAGWKNGLEDNRGQLTLKYIDLINTIDEVRYKKKQSPAIFFWENVEGVLTDKTNAFGCFLAGLAGYENPISIPKWSSSGILHGKTRNIAWRILDAKYFGLPQQRRRLYVLGGGKDFFPENVLFETGDIMPDPYKENKQDEPALFDQLENTAIVPSELTKTINGQDIEIFRTFTDCLYAAYGTKWNGNAAAFNGSLFVSQNGRLRRLTPIECERLMGFPDNYTALPKATLTNRFRATGNSWAVNVIDWIMKRLIKDNSTESIYTDQEGLHLLKDFSMAKSHKFINATVFPYDYKLKNFLDIIDINPDEKLYISKAGCGGILRRKYERNAGMNARLESILIANS